MKPLLAAKVEDLKNLPYPLWGSPKLDGIRCLVCPDRGPVTRSLKPIPNRYIRKILSGYPELVGLDGELIVGDPTAPNVFNVTTSAVMSQDGAPDFKFYVFDSIISPKQPFALRYQRVANTKNPYLMIVKQAIIQTPEELADYEEVAIGNGYEGVMVRKPDAPYKFGRSTLKEAILLKIKRFEDSEAEIIGFEELYVNQNSPFLNELGYQVRSTAKEGLVPAGTLGKVQVRDIHHPEWVFGIGSGFDMATRREIWENKDQYLGKIVKYKHQPHGRKDVPRLPIFQGIRAPADIGAENGDA